MPKANEQLNVDLSMEFFRFTIEHPDWAEKNIPNGAKVVMQLEGEEEFNAWARELADQTRQPEQPLVLVHIRQLAPIRSRIIEAEAEMVAA
jgi:hypothetical protein